MDPGATSHLKNVDSPSPRSRDNTDIDGLSRGEAHDEDIAPIHGSTIESTKSTSSASVSVPRTRDFGLIPIPRWLRHDPNVPFKFTIYMNIIFGFASTTTVANLYYCQPMLVNLAQSFDVSNQSVSTIPTITQAGYAAGLLLIAPLGDLVRRRPLLLVVITSSTLLTIGLSRSPNLHVFQALSFLLGVCTVTPQILLPFAGDLAPPERRATALSVVLAGLIFGIIFARAIGGIVADLTGSWRNVYYIAAGLQGASLCLLYWVLPDWPSKVEVPNKEAGSGPRLTYLGVLSSMAKLTVTEPTLIQGCIMGGLAQMVFSSFWVTLTFLLADSPYNYSTLNIALFGLVGLLGVLTTPVAGRLIDGLVLWVGILIAIVFLLISEVIMTAAGGINIGAVIVACFTLDLGLQMLQVSNTSRIFGIDPAMSARMNSVYWIVGFLGQVIGSAVGSYIFLSDGWRAAHGASLALVGGILLVLLSRGPHIGRHTWFGWQGRAKLTKPKPQISTDAEKGVPPTPNT